MSMPATCASEIFPSLWKTTLGDRRIRIAMLDGPVDQSHVALREAHFTATREFPLPHQLTQGLATEHGTYVASLIFGQHQSPIKGIAPNCTGLVIPIFRNLPEGGVSRCSQVELAQAIERAADSGAHIINISGGEFSPSGSVHPLLEEVLDRCDNQDVLIVAAAGNDGCECLHVPAAHPSILAVGAANAAGEPLTSSNWGAQYQGHGILALGERLLGAAPGGKLTERSGTSAATAIVSGAAGLLMSLELRDGVPNGPRIRQLLIESSDPCPSLNPSTCRRYLSGVLNVPRAVSLFAKKDFKMSVNEPTIHMPSSAPAGDAARSLESRGLVASAARSLPRQVEVSPSLTGIASSACDCGGSAVGPFVFAFGKIAYEFSSRARYDSFWQHMHEKRTNESPNPYDVGQFLGYLKKSPWDATSVIWTLTMEEVPIYAISTAGSNSPYVVNFLKECLEEQEGEEIDRVALAGSVQGSISLITGEQVPLIQPELRGTSSFKVAKLVAQAVPGAARGARVKAKREVLQEFLDRVYFARRNLGLAPRDRAINYIAMNAYSLQEAIVDADKKKLQLYSIDAEPSVTCRAGSDCWDVKLEYFFRDKETDTARRVYRITVDVSDVVPVTIGKLRYWPSAD
jgi:cyclic patellamide precursor peptide PatG/subtilase family protein